MKNALKDSPDEHIKKAGEIMSDVRVAMITTTTPSKKLSSRPMYLQEIDAEGSLWFFTSEQNSLIREISEESHVNVVFASVNKNEFLSTSGKATSTTNRQKMEELWDPSLKAWFKDGLDTVGICLLRIEAQDAEYWDAPNSPVVKAVGFIKGMVSDEPYRPGEHHNVNLH